MDAEQKPVIVIREGDEWIVRNEGDSAVLFQSPDKDPAVAFAKDMAEGHSIEMKVENESSYDKSSDDKASFAEAMDDKPKDVTQEYTSTEETIQRNIIVKENDSRWEVFNEGDTAILFTSAEKEQAIEFARGMAESHGVRYEVR